MFIPGMDCVLLLHVVLIDHDMVGGVTCTDYVPRGNLSFDQDTTLRNGIPERKTTHRGEQVRVSL